MDGVTPRNWRQKKAVTHTRELKEFLPPEVRTLIDQMLATIKDHEQRLVASEQFQNALIREAANKLRGAA